MTELESPPKVSELDIVYHPTTNAELRDKLWPLKLSYGDFQNVLKDPNVYSTLQVIAAQGRHGGIHAWAGVYFKHSENFIGVFVEEQYRKQGLGKKLRDEALKLCKEQGMDCIWQDRSSGDVWVRVKASGEDEERFPYEKYEV